MRYATLGLLIYWYFAIVYVYNSIINTCGHLLAVLLPQALQSEGAKT